MLYQPNPQEHPHNPFITDKTIKKLTDLSAVVDASLQHIMEAPIEKAAGYETLKLLASLHAANPKGVLYGILDLMTQMFPGEGVQALKEAFKKGLWLGAPNPEDLDAFIQNLCVFLALLRTYQKRS